MTVQAGSRLGPYELLAPIGAGGMGEVWRGKDTRLDRSVAVKILPPAFAEDEERRQRFEREAKAISSLNHPHICTLHDVGPDYLVMEFVEGRTLAERLRGGPLPLTQVLDVGAQIADALAAADALGWDRFSLLGHSMGAGIASLVAGTAPERIVTVPGVGYRLEGDR